MPMEGTDSEGRLQWTVRDRIGLPRQRHWLSGGGGRGAREVSLHWASKLTLRLCSNNNRTGQKGLETQGNAVAQEPAAAWVLITLDLVGFLNS